MGFTVSYIKGMIQTHGLEGAQESLECSIEDITEFQTLFGMAVRERTRLSVSDNELRLDYESLGINDLARKYGTSSRVIVRELRRRGIGIKGSGYNGHR